MGGSELILSAGKAARGVFAARRTPQHFQCRWRHLGRRASGRGRRGGREVFPGLQATGMRASVLHYDAGIFSDQRLLTTRIPWRSLAMVDLLADNPPLGGRPHSWPQEKCSSLVLTSSNFASRRAFLPHRLGKIDWIIGDAGVRKVLFAKPVKAAPGRQQWHFVLGPRLR